MTPRSQKTVSERSQECKIDVKILAKNLQTLGPDLTSPTNLKHSFKQLSDDYYALLESVNRSHERGDSPTLDACRDSLCTDMALMLDEADLMLQRDNMLAAMAQFRVDKYLERIQSAVNSHYIFDKDLAKLARESIRGFPSPDFLLAYNFSMF
jgi:hypothetical protein